MLLKFQVGPGGIGAGEMFLLKKIQYVPVTSICLTYWPKCGLFLGYYI